MNGYKFVLEIYFDSCADIDENSKEAKTLLAAWESLCTVVIDSMKLINSSSAFPQFIADVDLISTLYKKINEGEYEKSSTY